MSKVEETLSLLTPGSVWLSAKGVPSYVLCVTNENIPAAKQKQFPPQVVFADEDGELFSVGLDRFLEHRSFHHVEYELEQKIENLFVSEPKPEDETEGADDAAGFVADADSKPSLPQSILELEEQAALAEASKGADASRGLRAVFQFEHTQGLEDPVLNSIVLANALRSFGQEPNVTEKQLTTRLTFLMDAAVTLDTLDATFNDTQVAESHRRGVVAITVQSAGHLETILWNRYLGTYPIFTDGGAFAVVMLASDADVQENEVEAHEGEYGDVSRGAADEVGALMGDGSLPAQADPANPQAAVQPVEGQPQSPAEAFLAHVEKIEAERENAPAAPVEQQPAAPVQPAVNVVQINPQQTPSQNSGN